jgi:hypothetical protein
VGAEEPPVMWIYHVGHQHFAALQPTATAKVVVVNEVGSEVEGLAAYNVMLLPTVALVRDLAAEHARAAAHIQSDAQRSSLSSPGGEVQQQVCRLSLAGAGNMVKDQERCEGDVLEQGRAAGSSERGEDGVGYSNCQSPSGRAVVKPRPDCPATPMACCPTNKEGRGNLTQCRAGEDDL